MCVSLVYLVKNIIRLIHRKTPVLLVQQSNEASSISILYLLLKDVKEHTRGSFYVNFADKL